MYANLSTLSPHNANTKVESFHSEFVETHIVQL